MEQETYLAVKRFLVSQLGDSVADMPTDILGSDGKTIVQEWDAVFRDGDVLYLCEAKHNMTWEQVTKLPERIKKFKQFQADAQSEFHQKVGRCLVRHVVSRKDTKDSSSPSVYLCLSIGTSLRRTEATDRVHH